MEVRAFIAAVLLVLLPTVVGFGLIPLRRQEPDAEAVAGGELEEVPLAFGRGLILWALASSVGFALGLRLDLVMLLYAVLATAILVRLRRPLAFRMPWPRTDLEQGFVLALALFVLAHLFVGTTDVAGSDTTRHLMYIRKLFERGVLEREAFILSTRTPYDVLNAAYAYNSFYSLIAGVARSLNTDPILVWNYASPVLVPVFCLAIYAWGVEVTGGRRRVAMLAVALILLYWAVSDPQMRELVYPRMIAAIVYLALLARLVRGTTRVAAEPARGGLLGAAAATLLVMHIQWWVFFALALGIAAFWCLLERRTALPFVTLAVLGFGVMSTPLMMLRRDLDRLGLSQVHFTYEAPLLGLQLLGAVPLLAWVTIAFALGTLWLRPRWAEHPAHRLVLALVHGPLLLLAMVPFTASEGGAVTHVVLVSRIGFLVPLIALPLLAIAVVTAGSKIWRLAGRRRNAQRAIGVMTVAAVAWLLVGRAVYKLTLGFGTPEQRSELIGILRAEMDGPGIWLWAAAAGAFLLSMGLASAWALRQDGERWRRLVLKGAPVGFAAALVAAPGPSMSVWQEWARDRYYRVYRMPGIVDLYRSDSVRQLVGRIPEGALVVTDISEQVLALRDVLIPGDVQNMVPAGREVNRMVAQALADTTVPGTVRILADHLRPDYLLLSPARSGVIAKYNAMPRIFEKIEVEEAYSLWPGGRFALYRVEPSPPDAADD